MYYNHAMNTYTNNFIALLSNHPKVRHSIHAILQEILGAISMNHAMLILSENNFYRILLHQTFEDAPNLTGALVPRTAKNAVFTSGDRAIA